MRFDGIGATIRHQEAGYVAETLRAGLSGILIRGKPRKRYGSVLDIEVGGRLAAWVGLDEGNGTVYVEGKGETSPELVAGIRSCFPDHTAPRLDACEDYRSRGAFEALQAVIRGAAMAPSRGSRPLLGYTAFPDDPVKGRTWGNLKRGGVAYLRVYEAGKMPERAHWGEDAVRVEGEFRPHTAEEKRAAAKMTPVEVWGLCGWTHRVAQALTQVEVPRFDAPRSVYTADRTTAYLARTFEKFWRGQLADLGDWECIGRGFEEVWRLDAEARDALKRKP